MGEFGGTIRIGALTGHASRPEVPRCPTCGSDRPEKHQRVPVHRERPDNRSGVAYVLCSDEWHPVSAEDVATLARWVEAQARELTNKYRALPDTSRGALELARSLIAAGVRVEPDA